MKLPRDISGNELVRLLAKFGYQTVRQTGSHIRLVSSFKGTQHPITIPRHKSLKIGTLNNILKDVATYLETDKDQLIEDLFGR